MEQQFDTGSASVGRTGKIIFNDRRSVVNCTVRSLSDREATLAVESTLGLPRTFDLLLLGEPASRPCVVSWQTSNRVAVEFWAPWPGRRSELGQAESGPGAEKPLPQGSSPATLRASLDEVDFGIVLLDSDLHATFVNRAFHKLWQLSEVDCTCRPAFIDLMRHGQAALGRSVSSEAFENHVETTVARTKAGDGTPVDLRLPNREVLRFQCVVLPCGGRMLSYTRVTDIIRHCDELEVLRNAVDNLEQGIVLIDEAFYVRFANKKARGYWGLKPEHLQGRLTVADYIAHVQSAGLYGVPKEALEDYVIKRVTMIKTGDPAPIDIPVPNGRTIRAQCTALIGGGRMITYTDVTDLVQKAELQEQLATTDVLTGLHNRRNFMRLATAEWDRFQRYQNGFSLLFFDIDNFKAINDRLGHEAGDLAIMRVAEVCNREKRTSDIVARMGGDEFVILLPETDTEAALAHAKRVLKAISSERFTFDGICINLTISVGIARVEPEVASLTQLLKIADARLYQAKKAGRNCIVCTDEREPQSPEAS